MQMTRLVHDPAQCIATNCTTDIHSFSQVPVLLPLAQICLTGSIYLTIAIAIERYTTVCHPFFKARIVFASLQCRHLRPGVSILVAFICNRQYCEQFRLGVSLVDGKDVHFPNSHLRDPLQFTKVLRVDSQH